MPHPDFYTAQLTFQQLEDKLLMARENIDFALQSSGLSQEERRKLLTMSRTVRTMTAQYRNSR